MAGARWPLVGRQTEIDALRSAVVHGRGAVVVGEAGVGKTRLVDEVLTAASGPVEVVGTTEAAQAIPLAAFAHLLGGAVGKGALHDQIGHAARLVESRVADGVLFVDDVHHLDTASLTLLTQLVTTAGTRVVATVRTPPDPAPEVVSLWKDAHLDRIEIGPLSQDATASLVSEVLGAGVDAALIDRLWKLSRGNVLFLRELVLAALESRNRREPGQAIPLGALDDPGRRLRELVGARLARLEPDAREALELVAASEPLPLGLADHVIDGVVLEDLEGRGLIRVDGDENQMVRTAHPLHGEVLRAELAPLRRRRLLKQIVQSTETAEVGVDRLRIATWRLDAGDVADPAFLAEGAWEAFHRFDNPLAERLGQRAWENGSREGAFALVEALMGQGRPDDADAILDEIQPQNDDERARVAIARSANQFWQRADSRGALVVLEEAEQAVSLRRDLVAQCRGHRSQILFISGRFADALDAAEEVLADGEAPPAAQLRAGMVAAPAWAAMGRLDEVLESIDGWLETSADDPNAVPMSDLLLRAVKMLTLSWTGRAYDAEAFAADDLGLAAEDPPGGLEAILLGVRGRAAFARGRIARSAVLLERAVEIGRHDDWFGLHPWALAFRARAETYLGDLDTAREALIEAEARVEQIGSVTVNAVLARGDIEIAWAWIAASEGARSEALERAMETGRRMERHTAPVALDAFHTVVRLGRAADVIEDVRALASRVQGPLAPLVLQHCEAATAADGAAMAEVATGFERLGLDLVAAETLMAAAELFRAEGKRGSALTCEERAAALQTACDAPPSPAVALIEVAGAERLTDREQEVALLAARGHTSPEIAERLYISVRTVHTHLQRAYRKLGVHDRRELAHVFDLGT